VPQKGPETQLTQIGPNGSTTTVRKVKLGKEVSRPLDLIAADMVNALTQIPQIGASGAVIGIEKTRSGFDSAVANQLALRGYLTGQPQQTGVANRILTSAITDDSNINEVTLILAIDEIALKRTYEINGNFVRPTSGLFVRGYSPDQIRLDDRIFVANFTR